MNKEQRTVLSKAICEKAIERLTYLYGSIIKAHNLKLNTYKSYSDSIYTIIVNNPDYPNNSPAIKPIVLAAIKAGNYTVKFTERGYLEASFTRLINNKIKNLSKPKQKVKQAAKAFNLRMETEFMLKTSFDDLSDIQGFMAAFASKIK